MGQNNSMSIEKKISEYRKNGFPDIWLSSLDSGFYRNPILHTDYSDPDIVRDGDNFYMTASSFHNIPGLPVLHSTDLINWRLINYAVKNIPFDEYKIPQYGKAVWAPSIRLHNGFFYIYVGLPDEGIFMTKTKDPAGEWEPLVCVKAVRGWIDVCPLWDDDGSVYLVNAFANSRIGFKSVLAISKLNQEGTAVSEEFRIVYDGNGKNPTIEGPKLYKRNGYYYIAAPAGGVKDGWQIILRSKNIYGPYEEKVVLHQGETIVNGPHQGGWVELDDGSAWFAHFQDKGAYGRIVHLQPMRWVDDWPLIGINQNNDGLGEPVLTYKKPFPERNEKPFSPVVSDDFDSSGLGLQWQWNANIKNSSNWFSLSDRQGFLRLFAASEFEDNGTDKILWYTPNVLTQKFPAPRFCVTAKLEFSGVNMGERAGLAVMGDSHFALNIVKGDGKECYISLTHGKFKNGTAAEITVMSEHTESGLVYLRLDVTDGAACRFSYSYDGENFKQAGNEFKATVSKWVGAKIGLFCTSQHKFNRCGYVDVDWVLIEEA